MRKNFNVRIKNIWQVYKIAINCSVSKITFNFLGSEASKEVKKNLLEFKHEACIIMTAFGYEHLYDLLI